MNNQRRIHFLDIARGVAVIAVIVGHIQPSLCPEWLTTWVYSFHLPLFFIISGILINTKKYSSFGLFFKKTVKSLLVQYLVLSIIIFSIDIGKDVVKGEMNLELLSRQLFGIITSWRHTELYNALWFIPAIILAEFAAFPLIKIANRLSINRRVLLLILSTISTAVLGSIILLLLGKKALPWAVDILPIIVSFILFGQLLRPLVISEKQRTLSLFRTNIATIIFLSVNVAACILNYYTLNGRIDLYDSVIGNPFLFFISALTGSLFILFLSSVVRKAPAIERVGSRSITFYAFQTLALPIAKAPIIFSQNHFNAYPHKIFDAIFITLLSCIILSIISALLEYTMPTVFHKNYENRIAKKRKQ